LILKEIMNIKINRMEIKIKIKIKGRNKVIMIVIIIIYGILLLDYLRNDLNILYIVLYLCNCIVYMIDFIDFGLIFISIFDDIFYK
jgi:hypothetical protein